MPLVSVYFDPSVLAARELRAHDIATRIQAAVATRMSCPERKDGALVQDDVDVRFIPGQPGLDKTAQALCISIDAKWFHERVVNLPQRVAGIIADLEPCFPQGREFGVWANPGGEKAVWAVGTGTKSVWSS